MDNARFINDLLSAEKITAVELSAQFRDEVYLTVQADDFVPVCRMLAKRLNAPVSMFFAEDLSAERGMFILYCVFLSEQRGAWVVVRRELHASAAEYDSLGKHMYSASLFEREIREGFGIEAKGNPDLRRLKLHDEVWPEGLYPLRKSFIMPGEIAGAQAKYAFKRVEGEGIFEIPVGPVHAGIIGPGHFRFSVAGEPIINLELRLGWTHRGIEKILEGKTADEALGIFERISGDTAFGYGLSLCRSAEKIFQCPVIKEVEFVRALCLELERLYNHANDIGGMSLDVGFSFPAQFASLIKESLLQLNARVFGSRYLKGVNCVGGVNKGIDKGAREDIRATLVKTGRDFAELADMLFSSVSFMDRVDATGVLRGKTARDLGISGVAARSCGVGCDTRKVLRSVYDTLSFSVVKEQSGDVAARLKVRVREAGESIGIINQCLDKLSVPFAPVKQAVGQREGFAVGCAEAWRGPVRIWLRVDKEAKISRCKIVDPSFHNWEGLSFAVLGNIVPDFPLCNKSFDLSYPGSDL